MSDRAEHAKALTARVEKWAKVYEANSITGNRLGVSYERAPLTLSDIRGLAAALTASEAEVTRLETGIAEALDKLHDDRQETHRILERLLPATDTNGAHA